MDMHTLLSEVPRQWQLFFAACILFLTLLRWGCQTFASIDELWQRQQRFFRSTVAKQKLKRFPHRRLSR